MSKAPAQAQMPGSVLRRKCPWTRHLASLNPSLTLINKKENGYLSPPSLISESGPVILRDNGLGSRPTPSSEPPSPPFPLSHGAILS